MMAIDTTQSVPLTMTDDGTIHISDSRVTLDVIIHQFLNGATAEQIQDSFPSLHLRQIYGAIYYYLENKALVEEYLNKRQQEGKEMRRFIEDHFDTTALREKLRARREG